MTQMVVAWALVLVVAAVWYGAPLVRGRQETLWWRFVGYPRAVLRVMLTWRRLAERCDLAVARGPQVGVLGGLLVRGRAVRLFPPRRGMPRRTTVGMTVRVTLHPGQTPDMVAASAEAIAHAWRMHAVRVSSPERGRVLLTCLAMDPLATVERPDPATDTIEDPDALLRVTLGRREDGDPWVVDFRVVPHQLVVGATQSGKSTWVSALVCGLASRPVALVAVDLKGGMEMSLYEPRLSAMATDRPGAGRLLAALVDVALERMATCRVHGARSIWDLPEHVRPVPVVVLVDEVAEIFLAASRDEKKEAEAAVMSLVRLAQLGRAVGLFLVVAGQRVGADLGPGATALRAQLGGRVCHRVSDPGTAAMALGDLSPDAVEAALSITPDRAGVAVTVDDGGWLLARAAYVSAGDAAVIAAGNAHMTPPMPELIAALMPPSAGGKHGG